MASYLGIGADDPNHPLEVEGQVFISNVEQGSDTNYVPFEVYSDYTDIEGDILEGARQFRLRVTPSATTTSNVNMDMGIEPTSGSYFYISNPVENATLGSNAAFRIVQAGHVEIGSNLSVSGNIVASNIIGGSPLTLSSDSNVNVTGSGGLTVTGPVNVGGTVSGTSATYSGQVQAATIRCTGVLTTGGNVGIGTNNPLSTLHVGNGTGPSSGDASGSISLSGTGSQKSQGTRPGIYHRANVGLGLWSDALMSFEVAGDATPLEAMRIIRSGNVGIGKPDPGTTLDVNGTIRGTVVSATSSVSAPSVSATSVSATSVSATSVSATSSVSAAGGVFTGEVQFQGTNHTSHFLYSTEQDWYIRSGKTNGKVIIQDSTEGNVGIGNASPGQKLDVTGSIRASVSFLGGTSTDSSRAFSHLSAMTTPQTAYKYITFGNSNTDRDQAELYFHKSANLDTNFMGLALHSRSIMHLTGAGNVGIGLTTPSYKLDVNGTLRATGTTTLASLNAGTTSLGYLNASFVFTQGNITINNDAPYFWLQDSDHDSAAIHCNSNNLYILRAPVNSTNAQAVGGHWPLVINLTNNDATFGRNIYAVNEIRAPYLRADNGISMIDRGTYTSAINYSLGVTGGTDLWINYVDNYYTGLFNTNTRSRMRWDRNGAALMLLSYTGNLSVSGGITSNSDYRIKENIKSIDDDYAMSVVRSLDPKSFNWKDKEKDKGTEYGFLAQEVKALYPEMVSTSPGTIPMDQTSYPAQITSDTTMEITVSDGSTWTSGDKIAVNDNTDNRHTLTIHKIQNSVLSLTAETISSNMVDSNSETYIYGKEVDDFHAMKVSYLDPLMISALQQLDRRITALENR